MHNFNSTQSPRQIGQPNFQSLMSPKNPLEKGLKGSFREIPKVDTMSRTSFL